MSINFRTITLLVLSLGLFLGALTCSGQTNSPLSVTSPDLSVLVVRINGTGTVTPNYNGQQLVIDRSYAMMASGQNGFAFSNWTTTLVPELRVVPQEIHEIQTNGPHLLLRAPANLPFFVEYSSNLVQWISLQTTQLNGSEVEIVDPGAKNAAMRFYRASGESTTNSPTISFVMQSNLVLTANFFDEEPPVLAITAPTAGQRISNAVAMVQGTARDNAAVTAVWHRLNTNAWERSGGTTNWSAQVNLAPGLNTLLACAVDHAGKKSPTNSVTFTCVLSDQLGLLTNGVGSITRYFTGSMLQLGSRYTVAAVPGKDQLFAGWSGTLSATNNPLTFTMQSNLTLQANFVSNPFLAPKGDYSGLFYRADFFGGITGWADITNSGFVQLTLTTNGLFNGELVFEGTNRIFSGTLDLTLRAQVNVPLPGQPPLTLNLQLDPVSGSMQGSVAQIPHWTSTLLVRRAAVGYSNAFAGTYTLMLEGCDGGGCFTGGATPQGDSPAAVAVSQTGVIQVSGSLADNSPISQRTMVSADGYWPFYVSLYQGKGILIGWLNFVNYEGLSVVVWQKTPSNPSDRYYPDGFSGSRVAVLQPYTAPLPGQNAVNFRNGLVIINSGNLPLGIRLTNEVSIINNQINLQSGSISNLSLAITPSNGLFKGTFLDPVTGKVTGFNGSVLQSSPESYSAASGGWFLGTNTGGTIRLHPR